MKKFECNTIIELTLGTVIEKIVLTNLKIFFFVRGKKFGLNNFEMKKCV